MSDYLALDTGTLPERLSGIEAVASRVGPDPATWSVKEVGDGNLNLVFIVEGPSGTVIVKQALPYVRLVGDSWPLPLTRAFFEYHALTRQAARDPGRVPEVFHFDEDQALIVMEYLSPHAILRGRLIAGQKTEGLGEALGRFCARTAFRGSDLSMKTPEKKADTALFLGNVELCDITESLVFTDPYFQAEMNNHNPHLDALVTELRGEVALKTEAQHMLAKFANNAETLCHGDLHTGSVMCTDAETRVIDPEFGFYGPMGFDIGMLIANFLMAYLSQPAHRGDELDAYQEWILSVVDETWTSFASEFSTLWEAERTGILYPATLFEDQNHSASGALSDKLRDIWADALGFCGIEQHRRTLSLAHNADFESIEDAETRGKLEARNLRLGAYLLMNRTTIADTSELLDIARSFNRKDAP
ncbi:S-methyl-5-thioribose kinase [Alphaproteobacteria bacterium GH1-50]|uniref:S-methyl-5-thioribose kinase n=1 Tax=Kangsaoukella pontilimi TaxID=2691042 RepID=A0A7C9MFZ3_9RHOB|nr:S-methyl-5-thioribose kinase [Kangsaoukella pontilimi]MXQ09212.1 S-methyl-5-thioribose kinase [Kangsaoukella pontilimi]